MRPRVQSALRQRRQAARRAALALSAQLDCDDDGYDGGFGGYDQDGLIDETGYVQPTLKQLRDERGGWSIYHKNSIHTWNVMENGDVFNVQIS